MNHINILIVDDDLIKITSIIKTIKEVFTQTLSITQASCIHEAIENLQKKEFHLLISDLQIPLKHDSDPDDKGGESLIRSIYRPRNKINVPMYIVGLTQFEHLKHSFDGVWKVWHYDSSSEEWKNKVRDLIHHISLVKSRVLTHKIETIYVEGPTDKKILHKAIKEYYPTLIEKVFIDTINFGGGASWVERQLFIWSKSLTLKFGTSQYLKAVGIFDNDEAGKKSIENLRKTIDIDSAETKTFSIVKNTHKYSTILKSIKSKGIIFEATIEDLISPECFKYAKENGWLAKRNLKSITIDNTLLSIEKEEINHENLITNGFNEDEVLLILNKIDDDFKVKFSTYICDSNKENLISISYQLKDVFEKLKLVSKD